MQAAELYCFAYGSNMSTPRMLARVPSARLVRTAALTGFRVAFNKDGADGSAKCNIEPGNADDAVHGVVWGIRAAEKSALDLVEGPKYYTWWRQLDTGDRTLPVFTYVTRPGGTRNRHVPYNWYLELVIAGAEEHGLPPEYVERLRSTGSKRDPDEGRAMLNRRLLERDLP